jgi:peptidoglycan/LPS O-acetylase OafA/YrhL
MASSAERDRDALMRANGWRLLLIGGILAAIGIVIMFMAPGRGAGVAVAWFAVVPTLAGGALLLAAWVASRAGDDKPFA